MAIRTSPWLRVSHGSRTREIRRIGVVRIGLSGSRVLPTIDRDLFESEKCDAPAKVRKSNVMRVMCVCGDHSFTINRPTRKVKGPLDGLGESLL